MLNSQKFDYGHDWMAVDDALVKTWIQNEDTSWQEYQGQFTFAGLKVFADNIWQKFLSREYQLFRIASGSVHVLGVRLGLSDIMALRSMIARHQHPERGGVM